MDHLTAFRDLVASLSSRVDHLTAITDQRRTDETAAEAEHAELLKGELRHFPKDHQQKVLQNLKAERRAQWEPVAAVALFNVEGQLSAFERTIRQVRERSQEAPSAEAVWLERSGQSGVSADLHVQLQMLDELRRSRLMAETSDWPPTRWAEALRRAYEDPTSQEAATFIRFTEARHKAGWAGSRGITDPTEQAAAVDLRKQIEAARVARIPPEVDEASELLAQAQQTVRRAKALGVAPVNPAHRPDVAAAAAATVAGE